MTSLMRVTIQVECVVPHDLAGLMQGQIVEAIMQAAVNGSLSAKYEVQTADKSATLHDVPQAVKEMWLARLAADVMRFEQAKTALDELDLNGAGQLESDFLVWPRGSSIADVSAWFKQQNG